MVNQIYGPYLENPHLGPKLKINCHEGLVHN